MKEKENNMTIIEPSRTTLFGDGRLGLTYAIPAKTKVEIQYAAELRTDDLSVARFVTIADHENKANVTRDYHEVFAPSLGKSPRVVIP